MTNTLKIYIAGPYSNGSQAEHVRAAVLAGELVIRAGHVPFMPHLHHFAHVLCPLPYETWMLVELAWLEACDGLVRLPGDSPGADREVERAKSIGSPVWFGLPAFLMEHGKKPLPPDSATAKPTTVDSPNGL
jgi:hypothetical protein